MKTLLSRFRALRDDRRGNVLMIFGFSLIPMVFATGMGIDYARAMKSQTKLNAAADAAALSAVSQSMMLQTNNVACDTARKMFAAQGSGLPGVDLDMNDVKITIKDGQGETLTCGDSSNPGLSNEASQSRTVTVAYSATSANIFGGVLGIAELPISGSSDTYASVAPNIDFYIALDTSPSMALPTTSAGISTMHSALTCSFACHSNKIQNNISYSFVNGAAKGGDGKMKSLILDDGVFAIVKANYGTTGTGSNKKQIIDSKGAYIYVNRDFVDPSPPTKDSRGNITNNNYTAEDWCKSSSGKDICVRNSDNSYADSYWYAQNKGVRLRVNDEKAAVKDLMVLAKSYAQINEATYQAALYTFDHSTNLKTISTLSNNLDAVSTATDYVDLVTVNDNAGNGRPPNGTSGSEYLFSSYKSILTKMSADIPDPGNGTKTSGDKPLAFLFMVTDGMSDESGIQNTKNGLTTAGRTRSAMQQAQIDQCTAIKARGVRIAILYTEYTSQSIQDDEQGQRDIVNSRDGIPAVASKLTACASPGLMYTVKTDESITNALQSLFSKALAAARIIQ